MDGGQIGLALSYISTLLGIFQFIMRQTAEVESYVSGQRHSIICVASNLSLTPKHRVTHGCVVSIVATDALVLKHQAISIHNAD